MRAGQNKPAKRTPARAPARKPPAKKRALLPAKRKRAPKAGKKAAHKRPKPVQKPRKKVAPKPAPKPAPKAPKRRKKVAPKPAPKPAPKAPKRRKAAPAPKPPAKAPKRRKSAPKPPAKAPKPPAKTEQKGARSAATKRGWEKRRKRKLLLDKMTDLTMRKRAEAALDDPDAQPLGWTVRRANLREMDGKIWRRIAVEFSESAHQAKRLEVLKELEIDLLNKADLYDYLSWAGEHFEIDTADMYQMYLGYSPGAGEGEG